MKTEKSIAIATHELTKRYEQVHALDNLNLSVTRGTIFGLLGPNGAGKSTTIKILTTLLDPSSGSAVVAGFEVMKNPLEVRRRIGYVPQLISADGALTAIENLTLLARLHGIYGLQQRTRIETALAFSGLENVAHNLVKTYSGGMIRRLEIAQATLHSPEVLFLDEPTIGLDPMARRTVWDKLLKLRDHHHMTILITTHDMEEAEILCDELAILHEGKLAIQGQSNMLKKQVGSEARLEDVFIHYSGAKMDQGGNFHELRANRNMIKRLG